MKILFNFAFAFFIFIVTPKLYANENKSLEVKSSIKIVNKYAELYCSAKADNFFKGLDNEKKLKFSYFKYIGLTSEEFFSTDMSNHLIDKIKEKCLITSDEENEIKEFILEEST